MVKELDISDVAYTGSRKFIVKYSGLLQVGFLSHLQLEIKEIGNAYNQNYHPFSKSQFTSIPLEMIGKESAFLDMTFEQRLECTEEVSYEKMLGKNITSRLEL